MPPNERARVLLHIARGVVYMHELNPPVIHRDIKGGNVLLHYTDAATCGGKRLVVKISDFGEFSV